MSGVAGATIVFVVAAAAAVGSSVVLVSRLERLVDRLGLSEALLGVTVALAADAPELTSAVTAFVHHQTTVGSGVVLGSNVFNLAALLGLSGIVVGRLGLEAGVVRRDGFAAIGVAVTALLVVALHVPPGAGLAVGTVIVVAYLWLDARATRRPSPAVTPGGQRLDVDTWPHPAPVTSARADATVALVSLLVVVAASVALERSAGDVGAHAAIAPVVIGAVLLAATTSLPNLVGAVYLARRGRGAAVLSEATNSNVLNVLAGFLLPATVLGVGRATGADLLVAGWYAGLTALCVVLALRERALRRASGAVIVALYAVFVVTVVAIG